VKDYLTDSNYYHQCVSYNTIFRDHFLHNNTAQYRISNVVSVRNNKSVPNQSRIFIHNQWFTYTLVTGNPVFGAALLSALRNTMILFGSKSFYVYNGQWISCLSSNYE
jgi:hypothetical protein